MCSENATDRHYSSAEHEVYDALTNKVEIQINKFLKSDSLMANYAYVLVMMLRLRQCCNHPALSRVSL